jgi:hypothetical protein
MIVSHSTKYFPDKKLHIFEDVLSCLSSLPSLKFMHPPYCYYRLLQIWVGVASNGITFDPYFIVIDKWIQKLEQRHINTNTNTWIHTHIHRGLINGCLLPFQVGCRLKSVTSMEESLILQDDLKVIGQCMQHCHWRLHNTIVLRYKRTWVLVYLRLK